MVRDGRRRLPGDLVDVQRRIEHWRGTRAKRGVMPEPLWAEAAAMALRYGPWRVAQVLRVNYASLKARLAESARGASREDRGVAFVELKAPGQSMWTDPAGAVVELSDADGSRLVIRARSGEGVDALRLAEAFWRRRT